MTEQLPVGAYVASALMAAGYGGDSGEDVDRFLHELAERGYSVVLTQPVLAPRANTAALDVERLAEKIRDHYDTGRHGLSDHACAIAIAMAYGAREATG